MQLVWQMTEKEAKHMSVGPFTSPFSCKEAHKSRKSSSRIKSASLIPLCKSPKRKIFFCMLLTFSRPCLFRSPQRETFLPNFAHKAAIYSSLFYFKARTNEASDVPNNTNRAANSESRLKKHFFLSARNKEGSRFVKMPSSGVKQLEES